MCSNTNSVWECASRHFKATSFPHSLQSQLEVDFRVFDRVSLSEDSKAVSLKDKVLVRLAISTETSVKLFSLTQTSSIESRGRSHIIRKVRVRAEL